MPGVFDQFNPKINQPRKKVTAADILDAKEKLASVKNRKLKIRQGTDVPEYIMKRIKSSGKFNIKEKDKKSNLPPFLNR